MKPFSHIYKYRVRRITNRKRLKVNVDLERIRQPQGKLTATFHNRHTMHAQTNEIGLLFCERNFFFMCVFIFKTMLLSINIQHKMLNQEFLRIIVTQFSDFNSKFSNEFIDGEFIAFLFMVQSMFLFILQLNVRNYNLISFVMIA